MEAGVIPARSRRCNGEDFTIPLDNTGKGENSMNQSQKTCLYLYTKTLRAIGGV